MILIADMSRNTRHKIWMIIIVTLIAIAIFFIFVPAIHQWANYHHFADNRILGNIPNAWNVLSNLPFCFVSIIGFICLAEKWKEGCFTKEELITFFVLFSGIFLTGIGSAYYHLSPNNTTLVWDRLPMTIVFMSLLAFTIMERINLKAGFYLLLPLLVLGAFSVLYWQWGEVRGHGDLRLYGFVQFYSMILIAAILCLFPGDYPPLKAYIWIAIFYGVAKVCEYFDLSLYHFFGGSISGHTLKHFAAAISAYGIIEMCKSKKIDKKKL